MASGHLALLVHHNDPEQESPLVVPVALHNVTRRVRVTTEGLGQADPAGEFLLASNDSFAVEFAADAGQFIADVRSNAVPLPLPEVVATQTFFWATLAGNVDLHAVFAPRLPEGSVPPDWLAQYDFTNRNWMAEASLDQDGDGLLTWQEYELGSSPADAADAPLVVDFQARPPGSNAWRLVWHAFTNRAATYSILASTNPAWGGYVVFTNVVAAPPVMTSPPLPPDHRYFGLRKD